MRILIVEDEPPIADHIKWMCENILRTKLKLCTVVHTLESAFRYLENHQIDLLLLDLNLDGKDGFDILKQTVSGSFHTIIISAYAEQAITAFQYGVLDFIQKPFDEERLSKALERYYNISDQRELDTKYLAIRENNEVYLIDIDEIIFFKSVGNYIEVHLENGENKLLIKAMNKLEQILPSRFMRIHKSYLVDSHAIKSYKHSGGGTYAMELNNGMSLPLSRLKYKELKQKLI